MQILSSATVKTLNSRVSIKLEEKLSITEGLRDTLCQLFLKI